MLLQLEHDSALDIPAGARNFVVEDSLRLPVDVEVLGIYPHAHYLGKRLEAWATLPDQQKKWLILIPSWDIDRQSVYRYRKPVFLPKGSVVHMRYIYDNSSGNAHNPHAPGARESRESLRRRDGASLAAGFAGKYAQQRTRSATAARGSVDAELAEQGSKRHHPAL